MIAERKHLQQSESYSPLANKMLTTNVIRNGVKIQRLQCVYIFLNESSMQLFLLLVNGSTINSQAEFTMLSQYSQGAHTQPLLFDIELAELAVILRSCEE